MAFYFIHTEIYTVKSVLLFVSLIGRKMYFTVARPVFHGVNLSMYEIKTSHHGDCLNNFYLRVGMHKKLPRSFFFFMHRNS